MTDVYIGLGSNIGNREATIQKAIRFLNELEMVEVVAVSDFIETEPVGNMNQPLFINAAVHIKTILTPFELLEITRDIEKKLGRLTKGNYDPRTIDLDILFFGDQIECNERLTIPHPLLHERAFVLIPLVQLCPDKIHPVLGESVLTSYKRLIGF